ncbi:MAG: dienelactone hydrolase family protein [Gammaproteobacteria bacterium]|nr:dienelactone hydrolase family protein [Gammaproteobacteria bacterium]
MGESISLQASDGHRLGAYRASPSAPARGGIVIVQEVFGLNVHVRSVCDGYAEDGFAVIGPALFDRVEEGVELGYQGEDLARGRELRGALGWDGPLLDLQAAIEAVADSGKVGVVGYCWGGSLAWLSATRLGVDAAVCYYGGQIIEFVDETPSCPVMMHFGEQDSFIAPEHVESIKRKHAGLPIYTYPAGHGFNCEQRADYHEESASLARSRTLEFLEKHLG